MRVQRDAWLTKIGHKRPMRKGKSIAEANKMATENTIQIKENIKIILEAAKQ